MWLFCSACKSILSEQSTQYIHWPNLRSPSEFNRLGPSICGIEGTYLQFDSMNVRRKCSRSNVDSRVVQWTVCLMNGRRIVRLVCDCGIWFRVSQNKMFPSFHTKPPCPNMSKHRVKNKVKCVGVSEGILLKGFLQNLNLSKDWAGWLPSWQCPTDCLPYGTLICSP